MSNRRQSPWSPYPDIPIFLDNKSVRKARRTPGSAPSVQAPEISVPDHSVRYFRAIPPVVPSQASLQVPSPEIDRKFATSQPRRLPLRYFLDNRARVQNGEVRTTSEATTYFESADEPVVSHAQPFTAGTSTLGLGITGTPVRPMSTAATTPVTEDEEAVNFAQRIERHFWRYNSSKNVIMRWLLEILSWILSALCMGAILAILAVFNDKDQPRQLLGLTLNTYVAVLSKIASAALIVPVSEALGQLKWSWFRNASKTLWDFEIFDNASRGPWGSILLLVRTKGRALASLGAAVMLISLALDPAFQQVLDFPERWICDGTSLIPKITQYSPPYDVLSQNGQKFVDQTEDLSSIAGGFFFGNGTQPIPFGNGTQANIPLTCPTSNCTWPQYQSLGVCSKCSDVSRLLTYACINTTMDWIANLTGSPTGAGSESLYPNGTACGFFINATSEAPVLMSGYNVEPVKSEVGGADAGETLLMRALPLVTNPQREQLFGGSINFKYIRDPIVDFIVVGSVDARNVRQNQTPIALECVLSWCVKTIESSYFWATYTEEITNTFFNDTTGPFPFDITNPNGVSQAPVIHYTENVTIEVNDKGVSSSFGLSNVTAITTISVFDEMFPSFVTLQNTSTALPLWRFRTQVANSLLRTPSFVPWMPPNNVTHHVERLASALTNAIRSSSSNELVQGKAFSRQVFVSVRWEWLILPLSLLLLTLVFLVATIVVASGEHGQVTVRKNSAIATLVYGLPDDMRNKMTSVRADTTPRAKAKTLRVKLLPTSGWRVSGNLFTPKTPLTRPTTPMRPERCSEKNSQHSYPPPGWI